MERWNKIKLNKWQILLLLLIAVVQIGFMSQKEGYHMDELLTFELGNAEYNPWIVPTQPVGRLAKLMQEEIYGENSRETLSNFTELVSEVLHNPSDNLLTGYKADVYEEPVWITRAQFHDYIMVEKDAFNYASVYFNVKDDNHPPLYFMAVHTMSSLFRGQVNPYLGGMVNLITLLGCCIVFIKTGRLLAKHELMGKTGGEVLGLAAAALYGFSQAGIATTLFIRMYGFMTFFCVLLFYIHVKKWLEKGFDKHNKGLILVTVLGFWSQYFFLFYCLILALVTVILLAVCKRKKEAITYCIRMALAGIIGVGVYPFAVKHVLSSGRGVEAIENLKTGFSDMGARLLAFGRLLFEGAVGNGVVGLILTLCLAAAVILLYVLNRKGRVKGTFYWGVDRSLLLLLILPPLGYFLLASKMSPYMVDRYIMPVYPFLAFGLVLMLILVCQPLEKVKKWLPVSVIALLAVVTATVNVLCYNGEYLYKGYKTQEQIAEAHRDLPCICLYEGYGFYDNLIEFEKYDRTLLVKPQELEERKADDLKDLEQVIVVSKALVGYEKTLSLMEQQGFTLQEVLLEQGVHGDGVYRFVR